MDGCERFRFNGARGKESLQAAAISTDAEAAVGVNCEVPKVAGHSASSPENLAIGQDCAANTSAERQHNGISPALRRSPDVFSHKRHAGIIISGNGPGSRNN